jgi:hypothetical protein
LGERPVEENSTGGQGSRRAVAPSGDDDDDDDDEIFGWGILYGFYNLSQFPCEIQVFPLNNFSPKYLVASFTLMLTFAPMCDCTDDNNEVTQHQALSLGYINTQH